MFYSVFSKSTAIRYGFTLVSLALFGVNATENVASPAPDGSAIQNLAIYSYDNTSQNTIYANGLMQAPIYIVYELAEGYNVQSVKLKTLFTGEPLSVNDWSVSYEYNGFLRGVSDVNTFTQKNSTPRRMQVRYISTKKVDNKASICVELTVEKSGSLSTKSTCNGDTQNGSVHITAIPPKYLTKNDVELTDWRDSTVLHKTISDNYELTDIREQILKLKNAHPEIKSFGADYRLTSDNEGFLKLSDSFLSQYHIKNSSNRVGHITSWVAHPDKAKKIRFIDNTGRDNYTAWSLERKIPYDFAHDPHYIVSLVTYKLRGDKFLYEDPLKFDCICGEDIDSNSMRRTCQVYAGKVDEKAPYNEYSDDTLNRGKVERSRGTMRLIDAYGTLSQLTFGIRETGGIISGDYEVFIL